MLVLVSILALVLAMIIKAMEAPLELLEAEAALLLLLLLLKVTFKRESIVPMEVLVLAAVV